MNGNKYGSLVELSEQDLNDCLKSGPYKNWGCQGGYPSNAFYYAVTRGLVPLTQVPYRATDGYCNNNIASQRYKVTGYSNVNYGDENAIKEAVAKFGPVTVAIDASEWGFAYYSSGIYISNTCNPNNNNHAVLVVGYGTEGGIDYWIIKNSWGPNWGEVRASIFKHWFIEYYRILIIFLNFFRMVISGLLEIETTCAVLLRWLVMHTCRISLYCVILFI